MRNKKSDEPEKTPEQQELEQQVDAMMDPKRNDLPEAKAPADNFEPPKIEKPITVSAPVSAAKTAPALPGKSGKKISVSDGAEDNAVPAASVPSAPLTIDKLDELSESITGEKMPKEAKKTEEKPKEKVPPEENSTNEPEDGIPGPETDLEDSRTDKAVDDIVAHEGDVMLAVADAQAAKRGQPPKKKSSGWKAKLGAILKDKRTWIVLGIVLLLLFAVPVTRYKLIGLVIKKPVTVTVTDSKTHTPVSSALVDIAGRTGKTDASGKAVVKAPPGKTHLIITKKYYKTSDSQLFVSLKAGSAKVKLQATGRQVPIVITNKLTGKPVSGAEIKVLGTAAKTDGKGKTTIVLPTKTATAAGTISYKGFNATKVTVTITDQSVPANSFKITPAGNIYFLSNQSGKIDVVKTDLGGDNRKVILAGSGREDGATTSLLASRDWRYLVLKARRDTPLPALYLIDTATDKVSQFDTGEADFKLVGWYGHSFMYDIKRNNVPPSQAGKEALKSYDADNRQLNQLDQNQAEGNATAFAYQEFQNFYIVNGLVVYNTQWYSQTANGSAYDLSSKTDTIRGVQPNGQNKKDYQSFPAASTGYFQAVLYGPKSVYFGVYDNVSSKTTYYSFEDQSVKQEDGIDQGDFAKGYPTYLVSPSGSQTFWTELRDGKNSLLIGDSNAKNAKQIAAVDGYSPYGWYSDSYVLVSKNGSELYVMPSTGTGSQPYKITNYYKPAQAFNGYGYGYGGL